MAVLSWSPFNTSSKKNWEKLTLGQKKENTDEGVNKEESEEI
jgi:hypothetical protein